MSEIKQAPAGQHAPECEKGKPCREGCSAHLPDHIVDANKMVFDHIVEQHEMVPLPTPENPSHQHKEGCPKLHGNGCNCDPTPNISEGTPNISAETPNSSDPIAQAIRQMEEAARVLKSQFVTLELENRNGELGYNAYCAGYLGWGGRKTSLAEALGYKTPDQQREEKIKEAERLEADVTDLMLQADKLSKKAKKLREEAGL